MRNSLLGSSIYSSNLNKSMASLLLFALLTGCMPDNEKDGEGNKNLLEHVDDLDKSTTKLQKSMDELDKSMSELSNSLRTLIRDLDEENRQDSIDRHKDPRYMKFPNFATPVIKELTVNDFMKDDSVTLIHLSDAVDKLKSDVSQGHTFMLEGSPEHLLFKDSLLLFSVFNQVNGMGDRVNNVMDKKYEKGESGLSTKQEKELYRWFLDYIENKIKGGKSEWFSRVWNSVIKKDVRDNVILYYTNIDKYNPGVIAYHPTIQPTSYNYTFSLINSYNTSDYYSLNYDKPKQKVKILSRDVFDAYHINNEHDMLYILDVVNTGKPFSPDSIGVHDTPLVVEKVDTNVVYTQHYKIKTNNESLLYIQDYGLSDDDQVNINGSDYVINKSPIRVDLKEIVGGKILIKILNEGKTPPNTLLLKLGNYTKEIQGKTGEVVLLEFEE